MHSYRNGRLMLFVFSIRSICSIWYDTARLSRLVYHWPSCRHRRGCLSEQIAIMIICWPALSTYDPAHVIKLIQMDIVQIFMYDHARDFSKPIRAILVDHSCHVLRATWSPSEPSTSWNATHQHLLLVFAKIKPPKYSRPILVLAATDFAVGQARPSQKH